MRRLLESKNSEIVKWKTMFDQIVVDKDNLMCEINQLRKKVEDDFALQRMNQELVMENGRLVE